MGCAREHHNPFRWQVDWHLKQLAIECHGPGKYEEFHDEAVLWRALLEVKILLSQILRSSHRIQEVLSISVLEVVRMYFLRHSNQHQDAGILGLVSEKGIDWKLIVYSCTPSRGFGEPRNSVILSSGCWLQGCKLKGAIKAILPELEGLSGNWGKRCNHQEMSKGYTNPNDVKDP